MSAFPPRFYLHPDERVTWNARMRPGWAFEPIFYATILGVVLVAASVVAPLPERRLLITLVSALAAFIISSTAVYVWRRIATTEFVVTEEAAYVRRGQILLHVNSAPLDRITDLHVHQGPVGRALGFSKLVVQTAGGGLVLPGLKDAYEARTMFQEARSDYIQRLLKEAGPLVRTPEAKRARPVSHCLCPRCNFAVPVGPEVPQDVECPQCHLQGTLFEEAVA